MTVYSIDIFYFRFVSIIHIDFFYFITSLYQLCQSLVVIECYISMFLSRLYVLFVFYIQRSTMSVYNS